MNRKQLKLRKTLVAHALTMAFGVGTIAFVMPQMAYAQSNATGIVHGTVAAGSGSSVVLKNLDTNASRTIAVDSNGRFQATALSPGRYSVALMNGSTVVRSQEVEVLAGQGTDASFTGAQQVEISGRRSKIDMAKTDNSTTFTAKELNKLPVQNTVDAIIQLAPNTTRADSRYAGASMGGGAASENAYYINGFPVTNPLTQMGASELPFGAIAQAQVQTGGYGAEFGRSIGGVMNITTKSGSNNWEVGGKVSIQPSSLRGKPKDLYYPTIGAASTAATDGTMYRRREDNTREQFVYGGYLGGPIIKDKLFMFIAAEATDTKIRGVTPDTRGDRTSTSLSKNGYEENDNKITRYLGKFDWYLNDDHRLELTLIGDKPVDDFRYYSYDYATRARGNTVNSSEHWENAASGNAPTNGAETQILSYTGNITNNLTATVLYGISKNKHVNQFGGYVNKFLVTADANNRAPGLTYNNPQTLSGNILPDGAEDETKSFRFDLEYKLGSHTIRAGLDDNKLSSKNSGDLAAGGGTWIYLKTSTPGVATPVTGGSLPAMATGYGPLAAQGYYVSKNLQSTVTNAYADQSAQYIEDRWQVTKDILVTAGLRNEQFKNRNGDNVTFLEMKNQFAPRLSAAWDVNGDGSMKVFGSAGRYFVQLPTRISIRGASRSVLTDQYFAYTGVDADGAPTGLVKLSEPLSGNNEYGQAKDIKGLAAIDLKPNFQDEFTIGLEKALSADYNFGAKFTYRKLGATIDDLCDTRPFDKWAEKNGIKNTDYYHANASCQYFNPGEANSFWVDFDGKGHKRVDLSATDLGFEKASRKYTALDFFLEHPFRNGWYGKVNYTYSKSEGNTEGQTRSDTGQLDVALTASWDYPEMMVGANGLLPNDRTHQIKAFGFYEITPEWTVGGNVLLASGRPMTCFGTLANPGDSPNYNSTSFYCGGSKSSENTLQGRSNAGRLPWEKRLDLNLVYKPNWFKDLSLKVDIFNVFDQQVAQTREERYNNRTALRSTYGRIISYTGPREVKFTAEYNHKF